MHEQLLKDLDKTFEQRAQRLVDDAKADALANSVGAQAFKGYLANASFAEKLGMLAAKTGINLGKTLAAAAITAAGVSTAVVTFGIAPPIGLILGMVLDKIAGEAKYQIKTKALREGIAHHDTGDSIADPALLEPGMAKILRKLDRVLRRHDQISGGAGGMLAKVRHARTAIRGWRAGAVAAGQGFPGYYNAANEATHDTEINQRLFELRYYAQMLGNYATAVLDALMAERDNYVGYAELVYSHVVRQVHFSGNHDSCGNCCYSIPAAELTPRISQVLGLFRDDPGQRSAASPAHGPTFGAGQAMLAAQGLTAGVRNTQSLVQNIRLAQGEVPPADERKWYQKVGDAVSGKVSRSRDEQDVEQRLKPLAGAAASSLAGKATAGLARQGALQNTGGNLSVTDPLFHKDLKLLDEKRGVITGASTVAQLGVEAVAQAVSLLADEVAATARNRLIKNAVLKKRDRAFNLMGAQLESQEEAARALAEIAKGKDILTRSDRVAQKVAWYIDKVGRVEGEFKDHLRRLAPNYEQSSFATCQDAWNMARALHYVFKQYEKAITFLVYLEVILVEMDAKAAKELRMPTGKIYAPGDPDPPRPRHMASVESDSPLLELAGLEPEPDLEDLLGLSAPGTPGAPGAPLPNLDDLLNGPAGQPDDLDDLLGGPAPQRNPLDDILDNAPKPVNPLAHQKSPHTAPNPHADRNLQAARTPHAPGTPAPRNPLDDLDDL